ncbi:FecR family protein [Flagellimonas pacifica]|uniref:FecR family protein n=1 Tax=Flagellimonas pacifica TaxID=1247520 RepID=A0A285MV84_9FLAO|nr:FecR family protein [Allomuricauda parva]SNZ00447.1 FecR family protein [Allomuricauda parva]
MEFKLILKKINNTLTKAEVVIFNEWYSESEDHRTYFELVKEKYDSEKESVDLEEGWETVLRSIDYKKRKKVLWKYAAAAAIVIAGSLTLLILNNTQELSTDLPTVVEKVETIEVGSDKATLTLEDGSNIFLKKGESYETGRIKSNGEQLVYEDNSEQENNEIAFNYLTIPRGGQFFIELSDGTKVWLNSDTKLKYPVSFRPNSSRRVELIYGEAYFDVSPSGENNGSNFIVTTQNQEVEVLGTEFNVKAYKEEDIISTTLVEGKVSVNNNNSKTDLAVGHQSKFNKLTNEIETFKVNIYNEVSWKSGFFSFQNMPLKDIMTVLSRWYDIDVFFENDRIQNVTFNGVFSKKQGIEEILSIIENTNETTYKINGKAVLMK